MANAIIDEAKKNYERIKMAKEITDKIENGKKYVNEQKEKVVEYAKELSSNSNDVVLNDANSDDVDNSFEEEEEEKEDIFYRARACERLDDRGSRGVLFDCYIVIPVGEFSLCLCVNGRVLAKEEMTKRQRERGGKKFVPGDLCEIGLYQCRILSVEEREPFTLHDAYSDYDDDDDDDDEKHCNNSRGTRKKKSSSTTKKNKKKNSKSKKKIELEVDKKSGKIIPPPGYDIVAKPEYNEFGVAIEHPDVEYEPQNFWQYFWGYAKVPKPILSAAARKQKKNKNKNRKYSSSSSCSDSNSSSITNTINSSDEEDAEEEKQTNSKKQTTPPREKNTWMRDGWPGKSEGKPRPRPFTDQEVEAARFELLAREAEAKQAAAELDTRAKLEAAKAAETALDAAKAALKVREAAMANAKVQEAVMRAEQARTAVMMAKEAERLAKVALISTLPTHPDFDNANYATRNVNLATKEEFEQLYGLRVNATNYPELDAYRKSYESSSMSSSNSLATPAAAAARSILANTGNNNNSNGSSSALIDSLKWLAKGGPLQNDHSSTSATTNSSSQYSNRPLPKVDPAVFQPVAHEFQKFMPSQPQASVHVPEQQQQQTQIHQQQQLVQPQRYEQEIRSEEEGEETVVASVAVVVENEEEREKETEVVAVHEAPASSVAAKSAKSASMKVVPTTKNNNIKQFAAAAGGEKKQSRKEREKAVLLSKIATLEKQVSEKKKTANIWHRPTSSSSLEKNRNGGGDVPIIEHKAEEKKPTSQAQEDVVVAVVVQDREKGTQKEVSLVKSRAQFFAIQNSYRQHKIDDDEEDDEEEEEDEEVKKKPLSTTEKARMEIEAASAGLSVAERAKRVANNFKPSAKR